MRYFKFDTKTIKARKIHKCAGLSEKECGRAHVACHTWIRVDDLYVLAHMNLAPDWQHKHVQVKLCMNCGNTLASIIDDLFKPDGDKS